MRPQAGSIGWQQAGGGAFGGAFPDATRLLCHPGGVNRRPPGKDPKSQGSS
jgi:hypothetical protein